MSFLEESCTDPGASDSAVIRPAVMETGHCFVNVESSLHIICCFLMFPRFQRGSDRLNTPEEINRKGKLLLRCQTLVHYAG